MRLTGAQHVAGSAALATWLLFGSGCSIDDRLLQAGTDAAAGTGGSSQSAGGADGATHGCTAAKTVMAPSDGVIASFTGDAHLAAFADAPAAFSQNDGTLNIQENQPAGSSFAWPGLDIYFPVDDCIDASAFSGVEFTIAGTVSGCTLQYGTGYTEESAYSPAYDVVATATPTTIRVPWGAAPTTPGAPIANPEDPAGITAFFWQFVIPAISAISDGGSATCVANVNITNLKFYH